MKLKVAFNVDIYNGQTLVGSSFDNSMPPEVIRAGYRFTGNWQIYDSPGGVLPNAGSQFAPNDQHITGGNIGVIPVVTENPIQTITFDLAGGKIGNITTNPTRQVRDGQSISNSTVVPIDNTIPRNPERLGFTFDGWYMADTPFTDAIVISGGNITVIARWRPDPRFLNVSIPTSVMFQSNHINAQNLESQQFTITNHSVMGVHVDVANFTATNQNGMNLITRLDIASTTVNSSPIPLITGGTIVGSPNGRLLSLMGNPDGGDTAGSFRFSGTSNVTTETVNPAFNLILRFEVVDVVTVNY